MAERANLEPSLRDLVVLQATVQPSCIIHSENTLVNSNFELNPKVIRSLPKFFGNHEDDPHMHIKEFFEVCSFMKIEVMNDEEIRMRLFPFSLKDSAKAWFDSLPPNSITTWATLTSRFLQKFFPAQRTRKIGIEIVEIQQLDGEPFHEYWERYKKLLNSCPNHNIPEWLLMHCFYKGLLDLDRTIVDATSGGSLMNKTVEQARETFENVSNNSLHKYCGDSRRKIRKEIMEIQQLDGEPFHEYWERYKKLLNSDLDHSIPKWLLMQCFYEGLLYSDRMMVDATSEGSFTDKTPKQAREKFENVSNNSLHKYCVDSKRKIKKEILEIQQLDGEPFHEYWERYKKLLNSYPDHNIPEWHLMHTFYEGLLYSDRMMVNATSGGSLMDKTPKQARETFENVSNNSLHKYCVDSKRKIKKEILEIQQLDGEPFHEYWERYKKLLNSYPDHNIPEWHLMHTFYEGLLYSDRMMVNATSGGSLMDETPKQARETFEKFSNNSLQFNYRRPPPKKSGVYEVSTSSHLEAQITNLTNLVKQMMQVSSNVCAICTTPSHVNEACPQGAEQQSFNDFMMEQAYVVGPYQNNQRTISDGATTRMFNRG
ncbi:uncharacterized protein LOC110766130 [Prunus avium]|uniref:Uncharacterized protein LOC110766130 n=1 Tax=Prunus avium TaxID=42229 RepID=A0A6P5TDF5_PRUAV|nr:uncharacterized protein LOC110766130 [Prunus avium]